MGGITSKTRISKWLEAEEEEEGGGWQRKTERKKEERNKDSRPGNERGRMEVTTGERERKKQKIYK